MACRFYVKSTSRKIDKPTGRARAHLQHDGTTYSTTALRSLRLSSPLLPPPASGIVVSLRCTRLLSSQCLSRLHFPSPCTVLPRSQWSATPIRFLASRAPFQRAACSSGALLARHASRRATSATPEAAISRRCRHRSVLPTWYPRRRRCRARARAFLSFPTMATESCRSHRAPPAARSPCCSAHATRSRRHPPPPPPLPLVRAEAAQAEAASMCFLP